jgi:autotransporter-associated beta strand protein
MTQSGVITLGSGGTGATARFNLADAASNLIVTGGVVLNGNSSISVEGGDADSLVSINTTGISGTGNLAINDEAGAWAVTSTRLAINAASTFIGNTTLNEGTLILGHKDALSTGSLTITGASTIQAGADLSGANAVANALTLNNSLTVAGSNNLTFSGTFTGTGGNADRTLTNSLTSGTLVLSGTTINIGATGNTAGHDQRGWQH